MNNVDRSFVYSYLPLKENCSQPADSLEFQKPGLLSVIQESLGGFLCWFALPEDKALSGLIERLRLERQVNLFIKEDMSDVHKQNLKNVITSIPIKERQDVCTNAALFAPYCKKGSLQDLLQCIAAISAEERKDVCTNAALFAPYYEGSLKDLLQYIAAIPGEQRRDLCEHGLIVASHWKGDSLIGLLDDVSAIPSEFRTDVCKNVRLYKGTYRLTHLFKGMADAFAVIPKEEREDVCKKSACFIQKETRPYWITGILKELAQVPERKREDVCIRAKSLIEKIGTVDYNADVYAVVSAIGAFPLNRRENICINVESFIEKIKNETRISPCRYIPQLMEFLAKIPRDKREDLVSKAAFLINNTELSFDEVIDLFDILVEISQDELKDGLLEFNFFLSQRENMSWPKKVLLFRIILQIPVEERFKRLERCEKELREWNLRTASDIKELLQTPLNQPIRIQFPRDGMAAIAARGGREIDIHDGRRDLKTNDALKILRKHQKNISLEKAFKAADACVTELQEAIETLDINLKGKYERALFVLKGSAEGRSDWGPLLSEPSQDPNEPNLYYVGKETLGRLWLYIQAISDKKDRDNAVAAMISALNDSIQLERRICNPGKIERLFIAILQGRLKGVEIDDSITLTKDFTAQSLAVFFANEEHQKIDNRKDLLEAARKFCKDNASIRPMGFLKLLYEYMELEPETFGKI